MKTISRRQMLLQSLGLGGGLAALSSTKRALADLCGFTPDQTKGPFYPEHNPLTDFNNDLTILPGAKAPTSKGQVILLNGAVQDRSCRPIPNALVEIWQAAASGRYNHSQDGSGLELDRDFAYWGETKTDAKGHYHFKTIIPGHYPAGAGWVRPPHIHFKISALGYFDLVTQMYFDPSSFNDPAMARLIQQLNADDAILSDALTHAKAESVVIPFHDTVAGMKEGFFPITLRKARD